MSKNRLPPSIRQVARLAGVSIATVSRALATPEKVSENTLRKVLAQVERSRYRPNLLARNFRSKRAYSIVVLVPNIANPFFAEVIRGVEQVAQRHGYAVLLGDTEGREDREAYYISLVETRQADGLIQLHARLPPAVLARDGSVSIPLVNACECVDDAVCPRVRVDNVGAAATMTSHLLGLGHRRIAVILGPEHSPLTRDRLLGYRRALRSAGVPRDDALIAQGDFTMSSGRRAASELFELSTPPTAIFCCNDEMAMGAMQWVKSIGLSVPGDVSVAGFDDIEFAGFCDPPLTTIAQPTKQLGSTAMALLYEMLNGGQPTHSVRTLPTKLVIRASTAAPGARRKNAAGRRPKRSSQPARRKNRGRTARSR